MKTVCGLFGLLLLVLANYIPLPDPGLPGAFVACGASLCLSALALEIHPFIAEMAIRSEFEQHHAHLAAPAVAAPPAEQSPSSGGA